MCIGMLFLTSAAWALDPTGGTFGAAYPAAAAYPTAVAYPTETTFPAPAPSPSGAASSPDVPHLLDFKPSWGVALRGGLALPLEGQTAANSLGSMAGLDVFYHGTEKSSLDLMGLYASMPTRGAAQPSPLSAAGLAVKLDYEVYREDKTGVWVGAGVGYMGIESNNHVVRQPVTDPVTYNLVAQSSGGLVLLACAGAGYEVVPQWTLNLEILVMSLDSMDGTSNNVLAALPDLYVKWMY
jgi:hypothetical protein